MFFGEIYRIHPHAAPGADVALPAVSGFYVSGHWGE